MEVGAPIYGLLDILWWNILGQWMYFAWTKIRSEFYRNAFLPDFCKGAPQWFKDTFYYDYIWDNNLSNCSSYPCGCKPSLNFTLLFRRAARDRFSDWVARAADNVARPLTNAISNLLGSLLHSYSSFSAWIDSIRGRIGTFVPWWTSTLAAGLDYLRNKLPSAIRTAASTWDDIWEGIKTAVKDWAALQFDAAKTWVANNAPWVLDRLNFLGTWYNLVALWVKNFKADPIGTIFGWLDILKTKWDNFWDDPVAWICSKWGIDRAKVFEFFDHPMLWLYDLVDDEVDNYVETISRFLGRVLEKIITWSWENS